jgi:hypothetical protein
MHKAVGGHGCRQIWRRAEKMKACLLQPDAVVLLSKRQDRPYRAYIDVIAQLLLADQL